MAHNRPIVFLGPSLDLDEAKSILPARYLPPARCGDILRASRLGPPAIVLIDGGFEQSPAVWHKEILAAMACGITVFGAASMGALRAAEIAEYGMIGVGQIYADYRNGNLTDDDDVAVLHGDSAFGHRPFSDAMVNIRSTLAAARDAGVLTVADTNALTARAKATFYQKRKLKHLIATWETEAESRRRLETFVEASGVVDVKAVDARAVLQQVAARPVRISNDAAASTPKSVMIRTLAQEVTARPLGWGDASADPDEKLSDRTRLLGRTYLQVVELARLLCLAWGAAQTRSGANETAAHNRWLTIDAMVAATEKDAGAETKIQEVVAAQRLLSFSDPPSLPEPAGDTPPAQLQRVLARVTRWLDDEMVAIGLTPNEDRLTAASDRFRRARGLHESGQVSEWCAANGLTVEGYWRVVALAARWEYRRRTCIRYPLGFGDFDFTADWFQLALKISGLRQGLARYERPALAQDAIGRPGELFEALGIAEPRNVETWTRRQDFRGGELELRAALAVFVTERRRYRAR